MTTQGGSRGVRAYFVSVLLLLFVLPAGCVLAEAIARHDASELLLIVGKWFVFWAVGVRLFIAGVRQVAQPQFTAESIFEIKDRAALGIVRELGFANLSTGTLGLASLAVPASGEDLRTGPDGRDEAGKGGRGGRRLAGGGERERGWRDDDRGERERD